MGQANGYYWLYPLAFTNQLNFPFGRGILPTGHGNRFIIYDQNINISVFNYTVQQPVIPECVK
jgi:hypothetical protein